MGWFKRKDLTLQQALDYARENPTRIASWIKSKIRYRPDKAKYGVKEYWQTWEETLRDKAGDCEDFAILAYQLLILIGYTPYIVLAYKWPGFFRNDGEAHAVCAYYNRDKHRWCHMGNWGHKVCGDSMKSVALNVFKDAKMWEMCDTERKILERWVKVEDTWRKTK